MQKCRIIPFRKKEEPFARMNKVLGVVCVTMNVVCIMVGVLSLGYVLCCG